MYLEWHYWNGSGEENAVQQNGYRVCWIVKREGSEDLLNEFEECSSIHCIHPLCLEDATRTSKIAIFISITLTYPVADVCTYHIEQDKQHHLSCMALSLHSR